MPFIGIWSIRRCVDKGKDTNKTLYNKNRQTIIKFNILFIFLYIWWSKGDFINRNNLVIAWIVLRLHGFNCLTAICSCLTALYFWRGGGGVNYVEMYLYLYKLHFSNDSDVLLYFKIIVEYRIKDEPNHKET